MATLVITPAVPDQLADIAARDGLCVDEVITLILRQIWPLVWTFEDAAIRAHANEPTWQAWREHHHTLCQAGYQWPLVRP